MFLETIIHKIFETNSNFHVTAQYGKSLISVFREHFASINKIFILAGGLASGYHAMDFRRFPHIS